MIAPFAFATTTEILFGRGQAAIAVNRIAALSRHVFLVRGRDPIRSEWLRNDLSKAGCEVAEFPVAKEPDMAMIEAGINIARNSGAGVVVAIGGGSVIDAGKAIAAMVPAIRPMRDHMEVVGRGLPLDVAPLPFIAMPTTAGTGAEVTRNAVISVPGHRRKVSLRDPRMLPRLAVVDPALTDGCPRAVTLASGLDAITQVIEPYICTRANPLTDALCRAAIPRGLMALAALMEAEDQGARDEMAWVSLAGGMALANSGLGAVHGLAGPLGGLSGAPHGALCGVLLPHVLIANRHAVKDSACQQRLSDIANWIGQAMGCGTDLEKAASCLVQWSRNAGLPTLLEMGADQRMQGAAANAAETSSSMKANPAALSAETLREIMVAAG